MRQRILKAVTCLVIFFFVWTMGGLFNIAYAAYSEAKKPATGSNQPRTPEEKFQKALDDLKEVVAEKSPRGAKQGTAAQIAGLLKNKRSELREKRNALETLDQQIRSQFAATERKLIKAGLPQAILQRHHQFVRHYDDNVKELRSNLTAAAAAKTDADFETYAQKIRNHLEKTTFQKKHTPLDPNKLPHRISDIKRKEPRIKPEEFLTDTIQRASSVPPKHLKENSAVSLPAPGRKWTFPNQAGLDVTGENIREYLDGALRSAINHRSVIPETSGIQENLIHKHHLLLAANAPMAGLVESLPKTANLPQPLFAKAGRKTTANFNILKVPSLLKGNTGGFESITKEQVILAQVGNPPGDADLAETIDVQLTPAIKAKAAELHYSPVKIYNWVRNNVEYVPTYGSIQGADMCLQTLQGNDFDIASLLIALLRASDIHARYVYGTIELPIDKVMNWVGGFTNANAAIQFIASGGTPVVGLISGGKIASVRMEHVWVEAWINYYPLRGASHKTGKGDTWIPLDASYKQYAYTRGIDIQTAVPFDAQTFVDQIQATATIDEVNSSVTNINSTYIQEQIQSYQAQVKSYIDQNYPNATTGDVIGKKEIIKQEFSYLLGTLPYRKTIVGIRYSEIPDNLRHKITFKVYTDILDIEFGTPINITKNLPEIAGKKITLSYSPASAHDEAVINSYLPQPHEDGSPIQPSELPTSLPAYLITLKPELRIDGEIVGTGTAIGMGNQETFDMVFTEPGPAGSTDVVSNQIDAGAYHAIAINTGKISPVQMTTLKNKLDSTKAKLQANDVTGLTKDDILGDVLFAGALQYYAQLDLSNEIQAQMMGVKVMRWTSEAIFASAMKVNLLYGMPHIIAGGGVSMDVDRCLNVVVALDGVANKHIPFMRLSGINGSALEHAVPEQMFSTPSNPVEGVSAVKALQIANNQGIPIYTINSTNMSTILPQLQIDANVKAEIQNAVNAGKEVTVSKTNITLNGWTGCGYIIINPATGAGAYMISGGMNGGFIMVILLLLTALFLLAVIAAIIITGGIIGAIVGSIAICLLPVYLAIQAWLVGSANADQRMEASVIFGIIVAAICTSPIIVTAGLAWMIGVIMALFAAFMFYTASMIIFEPKQKYYCLLGKDIYV